MKVGLLLTEPVWFRLGCIVKELIACPTKYSFLTPENPAADMCIPAMSLT
jgi:hypothetical protein